jgi:predicted SpoU family rRNA methylase
MIGEIDTEKLVKLRGNRSLEEVARLSGGAFTDAALMYWEKGVRQPKKPYIKALLRVYNCNIEDILKPLELN